MTEQEKHKADLAAKDKEIADLKEQLAEVGRGPEAGTEAEGDVRARAVAEAAARDDVTPSPTQDELDRVKLGEHLEAGKPGSYKTRQTKAN